MESDFLGVIFCTNIFNGVYMNRNEVFEKLSEILKDIKDDAIINEDTALISEGILDSLELINYLTQIEENYDLSISLDQLADLKLGIVKNMIDYIISKK